MIEFKIEEDELKIAGELLVKTALNFTHPKFQDVHPEWALVCDIGNRLIEINKLLKEVTE